MKKIKFNKIQENVTSFLNYLELETTIPINTSSLTAPSEHVDSEGRNLCINAVLIGERPVLLVITSNISKEYVKIFILEIICSFDNLIPDALSFQKEIESAFPSVPVKIRRSFEEIWDGEYLKLTRKRLQEYNSRPDR